ncbi:PREDICTED: olfactory receptor 5V1 [Aptenodytes forsteri]|uniref:olfactory receptor 5V1 n=1 Tax=Aptenodytes forsteri TaxID=9233 RepID=UPI000905C5DB|nr:PREDICTED: olfactory receptor 5V1 [Aptenodytes forsteri]
MENQTSASEFVLLGLTSDPHLQSLLFFVFSVIYLITLFGNMVIMIVISTDPHLHSPMYFFLFHLALTDICYATTIIPYMLVKFLLKQRTIDFSACIIQMSLILLSAGSEIFMLSVMAYDRYIAICKPLQYQEVMNKSVSCGRTFLNKLVLLSSAVISGSSSFLLTLISYIYIISTVLKIQSATGRQKAFSTCSSHLIIVTP